MHDLEHLFDLVSSASEEQYFELLELFEQEEVELDLTELNAARQGGKTLLATCAYMGYVETFMYLIEKGLDAASAPGEYTLLYWALQNPNNKIKKYLLNPDNRRSALVNAEMTPLHRAVILENEQQVEKLLKDAPHYINALDKNGYTALFYAELNESEVISTLIHSQIQSPYQGRQKDSLLRGKGVALFWRAQQEIDFIAGITLYKGALHYLQQIQQKDKNDYHFLSNSTVELAATYTNISLLEQAKYYLNSANECYEEYLALHDNEEDNLPQEDRELYIRLHQMNDTLDHMSSQASDNQSDNEQLVRYLLLVEDMSSNAKRYGYECINVPGDGNCFFHAVVEQLKGGGDLFPGIDLSAQNLRHIAVDHIARYSHAYKNSFEDGTFTDFLKQAQSSNYWADEHLISALSRQLKINIIVLATHSPQPMVYKQKDALRTISVCNIHNLHFYSMQRNPSFTPELSLEQVINQAEEDDFQAEEDDFQAEEKISGKRVSQCNATLFNSHEKKNKTIRAQPDSDESLDSNIISLV